MSIYAVTLTSHIKRNHVLSRSILIDTVKRYMVSNSRARITPIQRNEKTHRIWQVNPKSRLGTLGRFFFRFNCIWFCHKSSQSYC